MFFFNLKYGVFLFFFPALFVVCTTSFSYCFIVPHFGEIKTDIKYIHTYFISNIAKLTNDGVPSMTVRRHWLQAKTK